MSSLVCLKKGPVIEGEKSISSQLRIISLSEGNAYETLHSYVSAAMAPYFKSFVRESGKADRDGDKMTTNMEKKIAELEMGLLHLQQNIDIPEISLVVHPQWPRSSRGALMMASRPRSPTLVTKWKTLLS